MGLDKELPLQVRKLTKEFRSKPPLRAVDSISFEVGAGEIVGLLGPNGAGKTTTLRMLTSILTPTSGEILYFGSELQKTRSQALEKVGFASAYAMLPHLLTVNQNLMIHGMLFSMKRPDIRKRATELLNEFGLEDLRKRTFFQLSVGQRTRVMLVKAFLHRPRIVLLDEPTASLDPDVAEDIRKFVLRQRDNDGVSVLVTSHNMQEVTSVCDRVIFLNGGRILANDTPINLAHSVGEVQIVLRAATNLKALEHLASDAGWKYNERYSEDEISVALPEEAISKFLQSVAATNIDYQGTKILYPTLEEFFLKFAK